MPNVKSQLKPLAATVFSVWLIGGAAAAELTTEGASPMSKPEDVRAVAPALEGYAEKFVHGICGSDRVSRLETAASSRSRLSSPVIRQRSCRTI
jgi:hypothetical protein